MAGNPFDAFDQAPAAPAGGNPFDAFDAAGQQAPSPSLWDRFTTNAAEAFRGNPMAGVERLVHQGLAKAAEPVAEVTGLPNIFQHGLERQLQQKQEAEAAYQAMPGFTQAPTLGGKVAAGAAALAGQLGGSALDPTNLLAPEGGLVKRMAGQGAINAAGDVVGQVADNVTGARKGFDPAEVATSAGVGSLFPVGHEALSFVARLAGKLGKPAAAVTGADVHAAAAQGDPDAHAILQAAGVTPEQLSGNPALEEAHTFSGQKVDPSTGMSPEFQRQAAERIQARRAADQARTPLQQQVGVEGGVRPGEGAPADRTPEAIEAERQRNIYDMIADGEYNAARDPNVGRQPDQGAIALQQRPLEPGEERPQFAPEVTQAPAPTLRPSDQGSVAGIQGIREAQGIDLDATRQEMTRRGYDPALVASLTPAQVEQVARRFGGEAPQPPPMEARAPVGRQPGIEPSGLFRPADLTDAHHPAAGDEADISRGGLQAPPVTDRVTGGTGDRPYRADNSDPNAEFWRKRAETQADDLRRAATEGAEPPTETPGWLDGEHAQAEAEITHAEGVAGGHPEGRDTLGGIAPRSSERPTRSVDESAEGHQPEARTSNGTRFADHGENVEPHQELGGTPERTPELEHVRSAAEHVADGAEPAGPAGHPTDTHGDFAPEDRQQDRQAEHLNDVRSVADQSGVTLDAATEQRAAEHVADGAEPHDAVQRAVHEDAARVDIEAAEHAAGTHAPEPEERVGPSAEPGPERAGGPDGPARERPEPSARAEAAGDGGEPQPAGHAEEPAAGGERARRPGEPEDIGSTAWTEWHRGQSKASEPDARQDFAAWKEWFNRTHNEREAAGKAWWDKYDAELKARAEASAKARAEREAEYQREEAERKAERDRERARRDSDWEEILRGHEKRRRQRQDERTKQEREEGGFWSRYRKQNQQRNREYQRETGRPSDAKTGDPFLDAEGTPEAKAGSDGRYDVGKGGVVKSDKGGPITFGDQKQAARWILKANKTSPDQIFEVANHPSKGGSYTVRETGRAKPNGSAGAGTTLYSNPIGPVARFLFGDAKEWRDNARDARAIREEVKGLEKPAGEGVVKHLARMVFETEHGHLRELGKTYKSGEWDRQLDMLHDTAATGRAAGRTLEEGIRLRVAKAANDLDHILMFMKEKKLVDGQVIKQVKRPGSRSGDTGKAAEMIGGWLKENEKYLTSAGVDMGHVRNYFPHAWDVNKLRRDKAGFLAAAAKAYLKDGIASSQKEADGMATGLWHSQVFGEVPTPGTHAGSGQGAPFKERVFSPRVDDLLDPYRNQNVGAGLVTYARQAARRGEVARRWGDNFQGDAKRGIPSWKETVRKLEKEGASQGVEQLQTAIEHAAGIPSSRIDPRVRTALSWVRTITSLTLLEKATFSALGEPFMVASQTGDFTSGFRAMKDTMSQLLRTSSGDPEKLRVLAQHLGIVAGEHYRGMLAARYSGGDATSRKQSAILSQFFRGNGVEQYTTASDVAAMRGGLIYLSQLSHELTQGGKAAKDAGFFLRDLGVPEKDHAAFGKFVDGLVQREAKLGGLIQSIKVPQAADVMAAGPLGDHLTTALQRFVGRTVQRPTAMTRPVWANHPYGAVLFQLQAFNYAYHGNVLSRIPNTARAVMAGELSAGMGTRMLAAQALGGMVPALALMAAVGEVRSAIYDSPETRARMSTSAKVERALSQAGFFGAADPLVQWFGASRYNSGIIDRVVGPYLGHWGQTVDAIKNMAVGQPKNGDSRSVTRNFIGTMYETLMEPALQSLMTLAPPSLVNFATRTVLIPALKKRAMDLAGPPSRQGTQPIQGGVTGSVMNFWNHYVSEHGGTHRSGAFR